MKEKLQKIKLNSKPTKLHKLLHSRKKQNTYFIKHTNNNGYNFLSIILGKVDCFFNTIDKIKKKSFKKEIIKH